MAASNRTFAGRHSMDSPEWYTPSPFAEAARKTMGAIDLDPASHPQANTIIGAAKFYDVKDNGLALSWNGRIFINPPGGLVRAFWQKLCEEFLRGNFTEAIWIGYSLEQLQTLQMIPARLPFTPATLPMCIPRQRIAFIENDAKRRLRLKNIDKENQRRRRHGEPLKRRSDKAESPSHANYITYVGKRPERFELNFSQFGAVRL